MLLNSLKQVFHPHKTTVILQLNEMQLLKLKKRIRGMSLNTRLWFHRRRYLAGTQQAAQVRI